MKRCVWCGAEFYAKTGQVYCSVSCRTQSGEQNAKQRKEDARRKRRKSLDKSCPECGTKLSMYGYEDFCAVHINTKRVSSILNKIGKML